MAEGEGRTLEEAFDNYAALKAAEIIEQESVDELSFSEGMELFENTFHPVEIQVKLRPHNQWVKGFRVRDPDR